MTVQDHIEAKTYSAPEAARRIGCSRATLWRLMDAGELGWTQVRNRRRFTEEQIDDYLANAKVPPTIRQPNTEPVPPVADPPSTKEPRRRKTGAK